MKRFLIIPLALIAFGVIGCAGLNESIFKGGASLTASIQNPVTREQQAAVEATYQVAVSTALSYARLRRCKDGETASPTNLCSKWLIVQKFKTINRSVFAQLKQLRGFMDANDQVNAIKVYNAIQNAIANFKSTAVASGV
jgi:hypothetical protein